LLRHLKNWYIFALNQNLNKMKKLLSILLSAGIVMLIACGPSAEEKAAAEKAVQDSIAKVQKAQEDSMAAAQQAAMEKAKADSTAAVEKMKADSVAAAMEKKKTTAKKPAPKKIEKGQPLPNRPGAVKK
jgi:hypothetical protein